MDYLQYFIIQKWRKYIFIVLNLVINGLPSILIEKYKKDTDVSYGFKPCYKWITFNTETIKENGKRKWWFLF